MINHIIIIIITIIIIIIINMLVSDIGFQVVCVGVRQQVAQGNLTFNCIPPDVPFRDPKTFLKCCYDLNISYSLFSFDVNFKIAR